MSSGQDNLLEQILGGPLPPVEPVPNKAKGFVEAFLAEVTPPGQVISRNTLDTIEHWLRVVDKKISNQLRAILHHPDMQRLEATWRGLYHLVHNTEEENLQIRAFNVTKKELLADKQEQPGESALHHRLHDHPFRHGVSEPFSVMVCDFTFDTSANDIAVLNHLAGVAAKAHTPVFAAAGQGFFGVDSFPELARKGDLVKLFDGPTHVAWRTFRENEDSKFVALTMPRVLARLPYGQSGREAEEYPLEEFDGVPQHDQYLWMNAAWIYATHLAQTFSALGWFSHLGGRESGVAIEPGLIHTMPSASGVAAFGPTEVAQWPAVLTTQLPQLGFLPVVQNTQQRDRLHFQGVQTCNKPKKYHEEEATKSAVSAAKLNFLLCACRFAQCVQLLLPLLKRHGMGVKQAEQTLKEWMQNFVLAEDAEGTEEELAWTPLADAIVQIKERKEKAGGHDVFLHVLPYYGFGDDAATITLKMAW
jgi:type VI secretion system protein ImpC